MEQLRDRSTGYRTFSRLQELHEGPQNLLLEGLRIELEEVSGTILDSPAVVHDGNRELSFVVVRGIATKQREVPQADILRQEVEHWIQDGAKAFTRSIRTQGK